MSRLRAGLNKLEASKRGLSDAYTQDEYGIWKAAKKAGGATPLDIAAKLAIAAEDVAKIVKAKHIVAEAELKRLAEELEKEHQRKTERMLDLGEPMPEKVTMTTNQPCKLTVLYEDGQYRILPFIGGEVFIAQGTAIGKSKQKLIYAVPELVIHNAEHGRVTRIEVSMEKSSELFDTKKQYKGVQDDADTRKLKMQQAMTEKHEKVKNAQDAAKERMKKDEVFGSW